MFNLIRKIKFCGGRFSSADSFPSSAPKFFAPQFTSSAANPSKLNPENSNQDSFPPTNLQNTCESSPKNPDSVIAFLKDHNFSETQISTIVKKWPLVLNHVPESSFRPKIDFFGNLGLPSSDIVKILTMAPYLLERSLENQIIPIVDFLRSFLRSDKDTLLSIMRYPFILDANLHETLLHNVEILRFAGVPAHHIVMMLKTSPGKIAVKPESFRAIVGEVQKLGIKPHRRNFVVGVMVMRQLSSSKWKEKIEFYKRVGWSEQQVLDAFRKHPRFMAASMDKITRSLDLLADRMGCDLSVLIRRPQILTLNFERTIVPRCAFYQVLLSKGLVEQGSMLEMMECLRSLSIESFVMSYAERDHLLLRLYIRKFLGLGKSRSFVEPRF
ncbi:hypothetical protein C2S52_014557 [Perilla frutescens var. hirtella]|nr:hypothetical protein C2S52_014557 [Perilla frutescens var. hirtella]